jgi:hypothetical protein
VTVSWNIYTAERIKGKKKQLLCKRKTMARSTNNKMMSLNQVVAMAPPALLHHVHRRSSVEYIAYQLPRYPRTNQIDVYTQPICFLRFPLASVQLTRHQRRHQ